MSNISPCPYPGCLDRDGNPRLTTDVICPPSRRHYAAVLDRIALNYALIAKTMPKPVPSTNERLMRVVARVYGHPAEWASDTCRAIADQLSEAHDNLAEHLGHDGPPHQGTREAGRVEISHRYLVNWFDQLCTMPGAGDVAVALTDLDRDIRRGLGVLPRLRHLQVPCPECKLLTLVRDMDRAGGEEVDCRSCGHVITQNMYGWWARMLLDDVIDGAPI